MKEPFNSAGMYIDPGRELCELWNKRDMPYSEKLKALIRIEKALAERDEAIIQSLNQKTK